MALARLSPGQHTAAIAILVIACVSGPPALAQPSAGVSSSHPVFEVASIKPNRNPPAGARTISLSAGLNHGRLTFEAVTLRDLIQQAYDFQRDQISGCPAWCESDRYDLTAKAEDPNVTKEQVMLMLQALLADRFQLTSHRETKDRPGFALTIGKSGSRLKPSGEEGSPGFATAGYIGTFREMPIAGLVSFIAGTARQPIVDKTGLKGSWNFTIDLTPPENAPDGRADAIDTFTRLREALEDQLGLKLESQRIAVENLVIESAERLSGN